MYFLNLKDKNKKYIFNPETNMLGLIMENTVTTCLDVSILEIISTSKLIIKSHKSKYNLNAMITSFLLFFHFKSVFFK